MSKIEHVIYLAPMLLMTHCRSPQKLQSEDQAIAAWRTGSTCESQVPHLSTGDEITLMYHWTDTPLAETDPMAYVRATIDAGVERNKKDLKEGAAASGLYLASDPFATDAYGQILVTVPIKSSIKFANWTGENRQNLKLEDVYITNGCRSIVYPYTSLYPSHRAVVLMTADPIETRRARVTSSKLSDVARTYRPPLTVSADKDLMSVYELLGPRIWQATSIYQSRIKAGTGTVEPNRENEVRQIANSLYFSVFANPNGISTGYSAVKSTSEFKKYAAKFDPEDKIDFVVDLYVKQLILPDVQKDTNESFPLAAVQSYFSSLGFDIGAPANLAELRKKVISLIQQSPEGLSMQSGVNYIQTYLAQFQPRSVDAWK